MFQNITKQIFESDPKCRNEHDLFVQEVSKVEPNWRKFFSSAAVAKKAMSTRFGELQGSALKSMFDEMEDELPVPSMKPAEQKSKKRKTLVQTSLKKFQNKVML